MERKERENARVFLQSFHFTIKILIMTHGMELHGALLVIAVLMKVLSHPAQVMVNLGAASGNWTCFVVLNLWHIHCTILHFYIRTTRNK